MDNFSKIGVLSAIGGFRTDKIERLNMRGRPIKLRMIPREPETRQFSPRGRRGRPGYTTIKYEEFESIRLYDYMGLDQKEAAKNMCVSQQTFSRILKNARLRLAEALINGDIIKISGGDFKISV